MRFTFNEKQKALLKRLKLPFDPCEDLTDEQYFELDDQVTDYLSQYGFTEEDDVNETGKICESILDILSEE